MEYSHEVWKIPPEKPCTECTGHTVTDVD